MEQQKQYVGIDLHRRRSVIVRITDDGEILETERVVNDPLGFALGIWRTISGSERGLTRSEIRDLFECNKTKAEIDAALGLLVSAGRIGREVLTGRGRPTEVWSARPGAC